MDAHFFPTRSHPVESVYRFGSRLGLGSHIDLHEINYNLGLIFKRASDVGSKPAYLNLSIIKTSIKRQCWAQLTSSLLLSCPSVAVFSDH